MEFLTLAPTRQGDHNTLFAAFYVLLPLQYILVGTHWYSMFTLLIPVYGFLLLPAIAVLSQDTDADWHWPAALTQMRPWSDEEDVVLPRY